MGIEKLCIVGGAPLGVEENYSGADLCNLPVRHSFEGGF